MRCRDQNNYDSLFFACFWRYRSFIETQPWADITLPPPPPPCLSSQQCFTLCHECWNSFWIWWTGFLSQNASSLNRHLFFIALLWVTSPPVDLFVLPLTNLWLFHAYIWELLVHDPFNTRLQLVGIGCHPVVWNSLPLNIRLFSSFGIFQSSAENRPLPRRLSLISACLSVFLWGKLTVCCRQRMKDTSKLFKTLYVFHSNYWNFIVLILMIVSFFYFRCDIAQSRELIFCTGNSVIIKNFFY